MLINSVQVIKNVNNQTDCKFCMVCKKSGQLLESWTMPSNSWNREQCQVTPGTVNNAK